MNDGYIVTVFVMVDEVLTASAYEDDCRSRVKAAEILTVAIVAARYFQNHHERTLQVMVGMGYIRRVSVSRFNRRLPELLSVLWWVSEAMSAMLG